MLPKLSKNAAEIVMGGKTWNDDVIKTRTTVYGSCGYIEPIVLRDQYKSFFSIYFLRYYTNNSVERNYFEGVSFSAIPLKLGSYLLSGNFANACRPDTIPSGAFHTNEYDVRTNYYVVLQSEKHYLQVTKVDKQTGLVEGAFMATFIRQHGAKDSAYPDTIRFQPSRFSAFIGAEE